MFRSLHTKILVGFLLVIALLGGLSMWAAVSLTNIGESSRTQFQQKLTLLAGLNQLDTAISQLRATSTRLLFFPDDSLIVNQYLRAEAGMTTALTHLTGDLSKVQASRDLYKNVYRIQSTAAFITDELHFQFLPNTISSRNPKSKSTPQDMSVRTEVFTSEIDPLFDSLRFRIIQMERGYLSDLETLSISSVDQSSGVEREVIIFGSIILLLCLLFSVRFANVIVQPIAELTEKTRRITAGELHQIVVPRTNDELGRLGEQFNAMAEKLGEFEELNLKKILEEKAISESIVQAMGDGLILIDRFGVILSNNRSAQQLFSLRQAEGRNCLDVSKGIPALETLCSAALRGTWRERNRAQIFEHTVGNDKIYLKRDIIPIQSGDSSSTVAFLLIIRDVTQAYELERMRSDFVGMVSHELRTPLTAIRMSVDLLAEPTLGAMTPVQEQFVQAIREESERLLRIVNDLMDLAKIESGKFEVRASQIQLSPFFEHLLIPFIAPAQESGITVKTSLDPEIPSVFADPDRLKQVFVNLISNAMRYTPKGGTITAGVRKGARDNFVDFFVQDTGAGIPAEFIPRIFQRFAIRSKDAKAGTGLGLAIAREIVQAHGGTIEVQSEIGKGTEFIFSLPLEQAALTPANVAMSETV